MKTKIKLIEIDPKKREDAEFISRVVKKYYPRSPFPPSVEDIINTYHIYFRAYVDKEVIGISGYKAHTPYLAESIKTIVFNNQRGKGYGKDLSWAIEEECWERGFKKIMTGIYEFNLAMLTIKLKQGYKIEGYFRDHEQPGQHEYTLGKTYQEYLDQKKVNL